MLQAHEGWLRLSSSTRRALVRHGIEEVSVLGHWSLLLLLYCRLCHGLPGQADLTIIWSTFNPGSTSTPLTVQLCLAFFAYAVIGTEGQSVCYQTDRPTATATAIRFNLPPDVGLSAIVRHLQLSAQSGPIPTWSSLL
jgi:hypothetical protein